MGVGLVCGLLNAVYAISYVGLAFPGPLGAHLAPALSLGLLSSAMASIVAALPVRYPGGMGVISPEATLVIGGVGLQLAADVAPAQLLPTMLATVALVTLATAAMLYGMGRARLGYLMHYLPYPVVAGLIGGLGVLLVIGGLELAVPGLGPRMSWRPVRRSGRAGGDGSLRHAARGCCTICAPRRSTSRAWSWSAPLLFWLVAAGSPALSTAGLRPVGRPPTRSAAARLDASWRQVDWPAIARALADPGHAGGLPG